MVAIANARALAVSLIEPKGTDALLVVARPQELGPYELAARLGCGVDCLAAEVSVDQAAGGAQRAILGGIGHYLVRSRVRVRSRVGAGVGVGVGVRVRVRVRARVRVGVRSIGHYLGPEGEDGAGVEAGPDLVRVRVRVRVRLRVRVRVRARVRIRVRATVRGRAMWGR